MLEEAKRLDYNVLFFCGSVLDSPHLGEKENNVIYNLVNTESIDALVSVSGTLANYSGMDRFKDFMDRFKNIPVLNISVDMEDENCISIDNYKSMRMLVEHLVKKHTYKRYVFLSGLKTNFEAIYREQAFIDVMDECQVPLYNRIHIEGDFSKESSRAAMEHILEEKGFKPDVIVCANDEMAIGVYEVLMEHGIDMPDTLAFTGFDNIDNATSFSPAFTTIGQPLKDIGKASIRGIHRLLTGDVQQVNEVYIGELFIRESCGCYDFIESHNGLEQQVPNSSIREMLENIKEDYLEQFIKGKKPQSSAFENQVDDLFEILENELEQQLPKGSFLKAFFKYTNQMTGGYRDADNLAYLMPWMKDRFIQLGIKKLPEALHDIFHEARILIGKIVLRNERKENYDFMNMYYSSSELVRELNGVSTTDEIFEVIIPYLETFNFSNYHICLFDEPISIDNRMDFVYPKEINMSFGYINGERISPYSFETKDMIPPHVINQSNHIEYAFFPMFFKENHFGYIACDVWIPTKSIFRTIKEQITNALERLMVQKKIEDYNTQLLKLNEQLSQMAIRDTLTNLLNRRGVYEYLDLLREMSTDVAHIIDIVYGDIDGLKIINDLYGHQEGDYAIEQVAKILKSALGDSGIVGRFGGDEFVCVIEKSIQEDFIEMFSLKVRHLLETFNKTEKKPYKLDISLGFSEWNSSGEDTIEHVLHQADIDLYRKKQKK